MANTAEHISTACRLARRFPKPVRLAIVSQAKRLSAQPRARKKLKGEFSFLYSHRFNYQGVSYRIIYEISEKSQRLLVRLAASRENLYRRLSKMKVKPLLRR